MTDRIFTVEQVAYDDPRGVALRREMTVERLGLYGAAREEASAAAEDIAPEAVIASFVASEGDRPVATGTVRRLRDLVEIKRLYLDPSVRGTGLASRLMDLLEEAAREAGADRVVLHTGARQLPAIALYERRGYVPIAIYPPYDTVPESLCFALPLTH